MKKLPDKLSDLLMLALTDLELVEKDSKYTVDMYVMHHPSNFGDTCAVCLAGSVMAKTLKSNPHKKLYFDNFGKATAANLGKLDRMRMGSFPELGLDSSCYEIETASHNNRPLWFDHMVDMIGILQAEGL